MHADLMYVVVYMYNIIICCRLCRLLSNLRDGQILVVNTEFAYMMLFMIIFAWVCSLEVMNNLT